MTSKTEACIGLKHMDQVLLRWVIRSEFWQVGILKPVAWDGIVVPMCFISLSSLRLIEGWNRKMEVTEIDTSVTQEQRQSSDVTVRLKAFVGNDDVRQKASGHPLVSIFLCVRLPAITACSVKSQLYKDLSWKFLLWELTFTDVTTAQNYVTLRSDNWCYVLFLTFSRMACNVAEA